MPITGKRIVVTGADYEDIAINRTTTRSITVDVTNGTYQGPETIEEGAIATVTITADTGYILPGEITVTGASYVYNRNTGVITLSNPTDDVAIAVVCTEIHIYTITVNVENGTYQAPETITEGTSANVTITPATDYLLPANITVTGANYTYNRTTGVIVLSDPTDNVAISATCARPVVYTITTNVTNGTYQGAGTITEGTTENITITPDTDYYLPNSVAVSGATYAYDVETGVIALSNPTDDVTITVVCTDTEPMPELVQGYWSSQGSELATRVCNKELVKGIQTITTNPGYIIRAVYAYTQEIPFPSDNIGRYYAIPGGAEATTSTTRTTYTTQNDNYYYGVTFAKADDTANILPTENIVKTWARAESFTITTNITNGSFTGDTLIVEGGTATVTISPNNGYTYPEEVSVQGATFTYNNGVIVLTDPTDNITITGDCVESEPAELPTLVQGYWSSSGDILPNRVCNETLIKGVQTITTKPGYVIRAVYAYTQEFTFPQNSSPLVLQPYFAIPNGMEAGTSTNRTTYTTLNANYYYGVTFAKTDATADILPTEDIVDSWEFSE